MGNAIRKHEPDVADGLLDVERAREYLARCTDLDEVKKIRDQAEAVQRYLRSRGAAEESVVHAAVIARRAERRLGELCAEIPVAQGKRTDRQLTNTVLVSKKERLKELGINDVECSRWETIASVPEDEFESYLAERVAEKKPPTAGALKAKARLKKLEERRQEAEKAASAAALRPTVYLESYEQFLSRFEPASADLLLTDPPYSTDVPDISAFARWVHLALPLVKPTGRAYICTGAYPDELRAYLNELAQQSLMRVANVLVWTYRNTLGPAPRTDYKQNWQAIFYLVGPEAPPLDCPVMVEQFTVQDINAPDGRLGDRYHAWQKPDELARRLVSHSTRPGELVIDPFACTGTFLLAATSLGRKAEGCDISEENLAIAEQRGCVHAE